jgi:hypothetical protein
MDEQNEAPYISKSIHFNVSGREWWVGVVRGKLIDGKRKTVWSVPCKNEPAADEAAKALIVELYGERRKA